MALVFESGEPLHTWQSSHFALPEVAQLARCQMNASDNNGLGLFGSSIGLWRGRCILNQLRHVLVKSKLYASTLESSCEPHPQTQAQC